MSKQNRSSELVAGAMGCVMIYIAFLNFAILRGLMYLCGVKDVDFDKPKWTESVWFGLGCVAIYILLLFLSFWALYQMLPKPKEENESK